MKKLIYILNEYDDNSTQHFYHIINLLKEIANLDVKILLIIEKCVGNVDVKHENIKVICQRKRNKISRAFELIKILRSYNRKGFKKVFIRISSNAAIISIFGLIFKTKEIYYWQSGTTYFLEKKSFKGLKRIKWYLFQVSKIKFIIKYTNYFVTGPETMIEYYKNVVNVPRNKLKLLYNDIDLSRFSKLEETSKLKIKKELGVAINKKIILSVHRLSPVRKTSMYLNNIFKLKELMNPEHLFIIIGDGPEKDLIQNMINENSVSDFVLLLGDIPNKNISKYYQIADIFINPSYTEGFPRVIIEAMASGLPIVSTDAGGTIDLVGKLQKRYILDKEDYLNFAFKLANILKNSVFMNQLSKENKESVSKYSTKNVAKMYKEVIFNECFTPKS